MCTAFEATRFYNVSESSPLARELCDGTTCNEVESSSNHWTGQYIFVFLYINFYYHILYFTFKDSFILPLQDLCKAASAITFLTVRRRNTMSVVHVIVTAAMMASQCVVLMARSTRTSVRWKFPLVETAHG